MTAVCTAVIDAVVVAPVIAVVVPVVVPVVVAAATPADVCWLELQCFCVWFEAMASPRGMARFL